MMDLASPSNSLIDSLPFSVRREVTSIDIELFLFE